jgi:hypothetical protein
MTVSIAALHQQRTLINIATHAAKHNNTLNYLSTMITTPFLSRYCYCHRPPKAALPVAAAAQRHFHASTNCHPLLHHRVAAGGRIHEAQTSSPTSTAMFSPNWFCLDIKFQRDTTACSRHPAFTRRIVFSARHQHEVLEPHTAATTAEIIKTNKQVDDATTTPTTTTVENTVNNHNDAGQTTADEAEDGINTKSQHCCWKVNTTLVPHTMRHKDLTTLEKLLQHSMNMNIKWQEVEHLFEKLGAQVTRAEAARPKNDHKQRAAANRQHHQVGTKLWVC